MKTTTFDPLVESGRNLETNSALVEYGKRLYLSDDFVKVLITLKKFGPLPKKALQALFPDGFSSSLRQALKNETLFIKDGCIGITTNSEPERLIKNNLIMQKLFAVLSEVNKTSRVAYFDYGDELNELVFVSEGNLFKLVIVDAGEEEVLTGKYNYEKLEATQMIRYIPIVSSMEQMRKLHIEDTLVYCKMAYATNRWAVDWVDVDEVNES